MIMLPPDAPVLSAYYCMDCQSSATSLLQLIQQQVQEAQVLRLLFYQYTLAADSPAIRK